ncbi:mono/diheme cytochrome c family protein [Neorhizobium huautlense]|uniref:Mono/diheme cytochrome c family protein n=1 Tax=Neorhizobium huautlense TaxID=67774 RepID=A0ABT9PUV7_9HYPH|nr:cytochrome c [Neorhizobium huautlense]MDP9837903.1 mono/diheme cytochrome c family protein [Neorhizobium huautlense]
MKPVKSLVLAAPLALAALAPVSAGAQEFSKELIEKGRYLATASDCVACHTNHHGGKPMAGGLPMASPVGTIMSTNITPSKEFGIGTYSETQFADAVRKGIRGDGANLYPAMPYVSYSNMTDEDIHALYAYFMQGVQPVEEKAPETSLPFPMNIRASMMGWNMLFRPSEMHKDDPAQSAEWNRGKYLAEGAAHCSTCHTPRGVFMQEQKDVNLTGGQIGPWYAPDITNDKVHGIGSWTQEDLVTYLKTGRLDHRAQAAGSMAEAISYSFQHLTDADLNAIATYVRSVSNPNAAQASAPTRFDQGKPANELAAYRGKPYADGIKGDHAGSALYTANCASCHGVSAQGTADGYYPSLFHNAATAGDNATNIIAAILYGVDRHTKDGHVFMPPFGDQPNTVNALTNVEVASLSNYILKDYGNAKLTVTPEDVQVIRDGGPSSQLVLFARIGMGVGAGVAVIVLGAAVWLLRRKRSRAQVAA